MRLPAKLFILSLSFIAVLSDRFQFCAADPQRYEFEEPHMGTRIRILLYANDKDQAITAVTAAFKRIREIENILSDYKASSEVMKLVAANDRDPGKVYSISDDLATVLGYALDVSKRSDGAFDVTVGPLSKLWRESRANKTMPSEADRNAALAKVGWKNVELDRSRKTVRFKSSGMRLDFGGIGKGYAADQALAILRQQGCPRALVAAAGDITTGDAPPGAPGWTIDIEPIDTKQPKQQVVLVNASVSTSGDLYQFVEIDGVRYSHVLNPRTGLGLTGFVRSTVIAKHGWQADALTKAACLLPPDKAVEMIDEIDGAAMFLAMKADISAKESTVQSRRYRSYLKSTENK